MAGAGVALSPRVFSEAFKRRKLSQSSLACVDELVASLQADEQRLPPSVDALSALPAELVQLVASWLGARHLARLSETCSALKAIVRATPLRRADVRASLILGGMRARCPSWVEDGLVLGALLRRPCMERLRVLTLTLDIVSFCGRSSHGRRVRLCRLQGLRCVRLTCYDGCTRPDARFVGRFLSLQRSLTALHLVNLSNLGRVHLDALRVLRLQCLRITRTTVLAHVDVAPLLSGEALAHMPLRTLDLDLAGCSAYLWAEAHLTTPLQYVTPRLRSLGLRGNLLLCASSPFDLLTLLQTRRGLQELRLSGEWYHVVRALAQQDARVVQWEG